MPTLRSRQWRFHGLKKPKVRQDWNKYNLYNISRLSIPNTATRTYFQQKWTAKASTRAYHGEVVPEKQWERMFSRTANAVVAMDPAYLAEHDGSEHAAGRGSGLEKGPGERRPKEPERTPYTQMVYHPLERRLDTAIFRALFASSTRQARQFVGHGHVKVNGKVLRQPGYLLNPGDMFQVTPEKVMIGTGAPKRKLPDREYDPTTFGFAPWEVTRRGITSTTSSQQATEPASSTEEALEAAVEEDIVEEEEIEDTEDLEAESLAISDSDPAKTIKKQILDLRSRVKVLLTNPPKKLSGTLKQDLRAFAKSLKSTLSRAATTTASTLDDLEAEFSTLSSRADTTPAPTPDTQTQTPTKRSKKDDQYIPNPFDREKPYATPWRPRDFMAAFAFIPRYLEVNQNICSAVYLRHPVCKPGLAEVPTPFHHETGQLTFNWYLRRR